MGIYQPVAKGTVTQANMRISAVDGTAFIDFTAADVLTTKLGHLLKIKDSAGRAIQGFIKAQGTGETLGDERISSWTNNTTYPYETFTSSGADIASAINTTGFGSAYSGVANTFGELLLFTGSATINSGALSRLYLAINPSGTLPLVLVSPVLTGAQSKYFTVPDSSQDFIIYETGSGVAVNFSATGNSLKQVLTPSATGVTISSTKGGSTMNWATKDAAFNYNDTNGYTYEIYRVLTAQVPDDRILPVYSSNFSAGVDGWVAGAGTVDGNIDSIGGEDNWLRFTANTASAVHSILRTTLVIGRKYYFSIKYYLPSTNSNLVSAAFSMGTAIYNISTKDAATTITGSFTAAGTAIAAIMNYGVAFQDLGGDDVFYIKDIVITSEPILDIAAGNALIDATDANAFAAPVGVDLTPYQDGRHILALYDASGYAAIAHISATAPSGEDAPVDLLASLDLTSGWNFSDAVVTSTNSFTATGAISVAYKSSVLVNNGLYKSSLSATATSGIVSIRASGYKPEFAANGASNSYVTNYGSAGPTQLRLYDYLCSVGSLTTITSASMARVTMPAATGVLLLSTKGGSRGWVYKSASFDPNAAMTAKILYVGD
jgi:hypothetical protein